MNKFLPYRELVIVILTLFGAFIVGITGPYFDSTNEVFATIRSIYGYAAIAVPIFGFGALLAWRWVPSIQALTFPYLGGTWSGSLRFLKDDLEDSRDVTLEVNHTLFWMSLLLDSKESESRTLAVRRVRDPEFGRLKIYYIYLNTRKEGLRGAGESYRGVAIISVEPGQPTRLVGTYFTDKNRHGTLELMRKASQPFWVLWR